jgi:hypothetical protein
MEYLAVSNGRTTRKSIKASLKPQDKLIGLALSGGGIRSNAFQLGIMSGLHESGLLKEVDYISAVSGGSWAAAAYKVGRCSTDQASKNNSSTEKNKGSNRGNEKRMPHEPCYDDAQFFGQLDSAATETSGYQSPLLLRDYSEMAYGTDRSMIMNDPLDINVGYTTREAWRRMLKRHFLFDEDILLSKLEETYPERPVTIINATHDDTSTLFFNGPLIQRKSFPFQLTSYFIGTIADCGNTKYCDVPRYVAHSGHGSVFFDMTSKNAPPLYLSQVIGMSSGVSPAKIFGFNAGLLQWVVDLPAPPKHRGDNYALPYRRKFSLSDGGHSENLGVLPLLERGVGLIIISDEDADPDYEFDDVYTMKHHAKALLDTTVMFDERRMESVRDGYLFFYESEFVNGTVESYYENIRNKYGQKGQNKKTAVLDRLNELLRTSDFYDAWAKIPGNNELHLNAKAQELIEETAAYRTIPFDDLYPDTRKKIVMLNRFLLEAAHDDTPKSRYLMFAGRYANADAKKTGRIILIKPPRVLDDFKTYLLKNEYYEVYNYLDVNNNDIKFPMDGTMKESYAPTLIHAYYLLGKFIASGDEALARTIRIWLQESTVDDAGKNDGPRAGLTEKACADCKE